MQKCPNIAAKCDEVPNWLRERLDIKTSKGTVTVIPREVLDIADSILQDATKQGYEMNMISVEQLLGDCVEAYNAEIIKRRDAHEEANLQALDQLVASGASEDEIEKLKKKQDADKASWPSEIKMNKCKSRPYYQATKFCEHYGYSLFTQDKPTRHLPRDHPHVQHVNDFIRYNIDEGKVNSKLVCNFDQVWSCLYEPMRKTLWKTNEQGRKDPLSKFPLRQKIRASLQKHFGQPVEERNRKWKVKLADIDGYGGANTVNYWRSGNSNPFDASAFRTIFYVLFVAQHWAPSISRYFLKVSGGWRWRPKTTLD